MLGFVGCGNMAQAMLKGILAKGLYKADEIIVSRRTKEALDALHEELGVQTTTDNKEVAEKADVLVLDKTVSVCRCDSGDCTGL